MRNPNFWPGDEWTKRACKLETDLTINAILLRIKSIWMQKKIAPYSQLIQEPSRCSYCGQSGYLHIWGCRRCRCHIFFLHCMKFCCEVRQSRSETRYKAEYPDQLILYPVKKLIVANRNNENRLPKKQSTKSPITSNSRIKQHPTPPFSRSTLISTLDFHFPTIF